MPTWGHFLLPAVAACMFLVLPGFVLALGAARRPVHALLLSPVLSVAVIGLAGIVAGRIGVPWSPWVVAALTMVLFIPVFLVRWRLDLHPWDAPVARDPESSLAPGPSAEGADLPAGIAPTVVGARSDTARAVLVGALIGCVLWLWHVVTILGRPDAISQTLDNIFHLSAVRLILESADASALTLTRLNAAPGETTFYPAGWHDIASLVAMSTGTTVPIASNATLLATTFAWVLSCQFLVRCILPGSRLVAWSTGVLSASFSAFPGLALYFGVLYPNLLGVSLAPVMVGAGVQLLRVTPVRVLSQASALLILLASTVGVTIAHPNAVMTTLVIAGCAVAVVCLRWITAALRGRAPVSAGIIAVIALVTFGIVFLVAWTRLRPPAELLMWEPPMDLRTALYQWILLCPMWFPPAILLSVLLVLGLYRVVRRRENLWLGLSHVALGYAWMVIASHPLDTYRRLVTGVWYTDAFRVAMVIPLVALPLAAMGIVQARDILTARVPMLRAPRRRTIPVAAVVLLAVCTQLLPPMARSIGEFSRPYRLNAKSQLLTADEYTLIQRIPQHVPRGETIATNPWTGSSLAYAIAGARTTNIHVLAYMSPDEVVVDLRLRDAAQDPEVCSALQRMNVHYALDFGKQEVNGFDHDYTGFRDLASAPGFDVVDQQGEARLYRITACDG